MKFFLSVMVFGSFIIGSLALTNCRTYELTDASITDEVESVSTEEMVSPQISKASFTFIDIKVEGDTLIATVQYSGGCGNHEFEIETAGFLMKSLPPKQPIRISHRSDNDPCRSLIQEEIKFDLSSFRGTPDGITVLILENWPQHINYSY
ncbi:MAG TPA: hypothetical protein EYN28_06560 [Flavobacteriales bacterium]|nr:hypothetical protein [Flavobacteriales bacterium]HIO59821.1 hypothetical protein [Flavobacteriales bacterium]